jgi:hypothetical protein
MFDLRKKAGDENTEQRKIRDMLTFTGNLS